MKGKLAVLLLVIVTRVGIKKKILYLLKIIFHFSPLRERLIDYGILIDVGILLCIKTTGNGKAEIGSITRDSNFISFRRRKE